MNPPGREMTEEEWIAASQACCGADPGDEADESRPSEACEPPAPPSPNSHEQPAGR